MVMRLVSSTTVITETSELSLSSAMKSLVMPGSATRSACGITIRRSASRRDMPSESAASICPLGIACRPAR